MKKYIYCLTCFCLLFTAAVAQDFPSNSGLEQWQTTPYEEPENWSTLNALIIDGYSASTTRTTDAYSGQYAARLESQGSFINIPALLSSGSLFSNGEPFSLKHIKVPFTTRPSSLHFYYKAAPITGDTCTAVMLMTRWNSAAQSADTIAYLVFDAAAIVNSYTPAELHFTYRSTAQPDSALLYFSSSKNIQQAVPGSIFIIDQVSLAFPTGMDEIAATGAMRIYPNPASQKVSIHTSPGDLLTVLDINGSKKLSLQVIKELTEIDISMFTPGIYFILARTGETITGKHKLVIE